MVSCFLLQACKDQNISFDKIGWNEQADGKACPPLRERMVEDLVTNHTLIGLKYSEVIAKLGTADNNRSTPVGTLRFELSVDYKSGDIFHVKALDLNYIRDSTVTSWKIVEYDVDL